MNTTRISLLDKVKVNGDADAWEEFYTLYHDLIRRYARARGIGGADAVDAGVDLFAPCHGQFRRDVTRRPHGLSQIKAAHEWQPTGRAISHAHGNAPIHEHYFAKLANHDVVGLEIAVDDPPAVGEGNGIGQR